MAVKYLDGAANMVKGLDAAETGMKLESFRQRAEPQFIEPSLDINGHRDGAAVSHDKTSYTVSGELVFSAEALQGFFKTAIDATDGLFATAITLGGANAESDLVDGGGLYVTSAEVTKDRGSWQAISLEIESYADQS